MSEEGKTFHTKGALGWVEKHTVAGESAEVFRKMLDVLCDVGTGYQNVIHIREDEVQEDVIHEYLERMHCCTGRAAYAGTRRLRREW